MMFAFAGLKRILLADVATACARSPATPSSNNEAPPDWLSRPRRWLENHRVRQRLWRCALLDPRFAKDIGLSELDIASECNTPFWVPVRRSRSLRRSISDRAEPE
jgi:uncharacterized protein YjiS (DUF1127 family)